MVDIVVNSPKELTTTFYAYIKPVWKRFRLAALEDKETGGKFAPISTTYAGMYGAGSKLAAKTPRQDKTGYIKIIIEDGTEFPDEYIKLALSLEKPKRKK